MSKDKLIILADKLDKNGHAKEAALVDEVIFKRSFDEQVRGDIKSVLDMVLELTSELSQAVTTGVAGLPMEKGSDIRQKGFRGSLNEDEPLAEWYQDKLRRITEGVEYAQGFADLTAEDPESDAPESPSLEGGSEKPVAPEIKGPAKPDDEDKGEGFDAASWSDTQSHIEGKAEWWKQTLDRMNQKEAEKDSSEDENSE